MSTNSRFWDPQTVEAPLKVFDKVFADMFHIFSTTIQRC